jgi:hypothetical protein
MMPIIQRLEVNKTIFFALVNLLHGGIQGLHKLNLIFFLGWEILAKELASVKYNSYGVISAFLKLVDWSAVQNVTKIEIKEPYYLFHYKNNEL